MVALATAVAFRTVQASSVDRRESDGPAVMDRALRMGRRRALTAATLIGRATVIFALLLAAVGVTRVPPASAATGSSLLIADLRNNRLLITDFNGNLKWKFDNPTGRTSGTPGPLGVRWMPNNQILATFGTGEVGLIDVATKKWVWKTLGYNGDWFQSPYDAEILPDGNLAVATRFNEGGRITVYNRSTGAVVWKHLLSNAHTVHYLTAAQSFDHTYPTLLVGGWGAIREVAYMPSGGQKITWSAKTEYTHDALLVETNKILTTEGYYIQKIDQFGNQLWKWMTPDEERRIAVNPNGGYIYSVGEGDRIEFRDTAGKLLRQWSAVSDGTHLDYPYGIQVVDYGGTTPSPTPTPTPPPTGTTVFSDGFESGTFGSWTSVRTAAGGTATVQSTTVKSGTRAASFASTGSSGAYAYARKGLSPALQRLTAAGDFLVKVEGASGGNVPLLRLYNTSGTRLISLYRQNLASNKVYVSYNGLYQLTSASLPLNTWGRFSVRVIVNGSASTIEVRFNGSVVFSTTSAGLGTLSVGTVQIGNDTASQKYTVIADNILVTT
jgi:hypothetical protein